MTNAWSELVEAMRTMEASRMVLICAIGEKERVEALLLRYDLSEVWEIRESRHCEADKVFFVRNPELMDI